MMTPFDPPAEIQVVGEKSSLSSRWGEAPDVFVALRALDVAEVVAVVLLLQATSLMTTLVSDGPPRVVEPCAIAYEL